MRSAWPTIILVIVLLGALGVWVGYKYTPWYRDWFVARYDQIQIGDTHERMVELLGKPDHYCPVKSLEPSSDPGVMIEHAIGKIEIYEVGEDAFGIEFPYTEDTAGSSEPKFGSAKQKMQKHLDICLGGDPKY